MTREECVAIVKARDGRCRFRALAAARDTSSLHIADRTVITNAFNNRCRLATQVHEPGKRSQQADPTDPEQCIALCGSHHEWIHAHPRLAAFLGLLASVKYDALPTR